MSEIESISDQLGGYADEVSREVFEQMKRNPKLSISEAIEIVKIATEDMKNDCLWKRLKQLSESLDDIAEEISYLKEEN